MRQVLFFLLIVLLLINRYIVAPVYAFEDVIETFEADNSYKTDESYLATVSYSISTDAFDGNGAVKVDYTLQNNGYFMLTKEFIAPHDWSEADFLNIAVKGHSGASEDFKVYFEESDGNGWIYLFSNSIINSSNYMTGLVPISSFTDDSFDADGTSSNPSTLGYTSIKKWRLQVVNTTGATISNSIYFDDFRVFSIPREPFPRQDASVDASGVQSSANPGGKQIEINFGTLMDESTLTDTNIQIYETDSSGNTIAQVAGTLSSFSSYYKSIFFTPTANLNANSYYKVFLDSDILISSASTIVAPVLTPFTSPDSYAFNTRFPVVTSAGSIIQNVHGQYMEILTVPAGAVSSDVTLDISTGIDLSPYPIDNPYLVPLDVSVDMTSPSPIDLVSSPATLEMTYTLDDLNEARGLNTEGLSVFYWNGSGWTKEGGTVGSYKITVSVDHLSLFSLFDDQTPGKDNIFTVSLSSTTFTPNGDGMNDTVRFKYKLLKEGRTTIKIYNTGGDVVRVIQEEVNQIAGNHSAEWDGTDDFSSSVKSGIYIYQIRTVPLDSTIGSSARGVIGVMTR